MISAPTLHTPTRMEAGKGHNDAEGLRSAPAPAAIKNIPPIVMPTESQDPWRPNRQGGEGPGRAPRQKARSWLTLTSAEPCRQHPREGREDRAGEGEWIRERGNTGAIHRWENLARHGLR